MRVKDGIAVVSQGGGHIDITDVFDEKDIFTWVAQYYYPEEVFPEDDLVAWADQQGFVKESEE